MFVCIVMVCTVEARQQIRIPNTRAVQGISAWNSYMIWFSVRVDEQSLEKHSLLDSSSQNPKTNWEQAEWTRVEESREPPACSCQPELALSLRHVQE